MHSKTTRRTFVKGLAASGLLGGLGRARALAQPGLGLDQCRATHGIGRYRI